MSFAQRVKFLNQETRLKAHYGNNILSKTQVFNWEKKFNIGRENMANVSLDRQPRSSVTADQIIAVHDLIDADRPGG